MLNGDGTKELNSQVFEFKTNTVDLSYQEMVAAMSRLAVQLAQQQADAIIEQKTR